MPETIPKVSSQPIADAVQESVANFSSDIQDALEQDKRRSIGDRITSEKQFQSFGLLDTTASESIPNGQVQNVIRQTPAKSVAVASASQNYLAEDSTIGIFAALERVFSSKLNITRELSAFNKDSLDRYSDSLKAKINQNKVELEAELEKMTAQQAALQMSITGAAIQLASTLLSVGGSVLNQILTRPDSTRVQEVQDAPQRFGSIQTGREIPQDETRGEAQVFVPGVDQSYSPSQIRKLDTRGPASQLEIELKADETTKSIRPESIERSSVGNIEIELQQETTPQSRNQITRSNISELHNEVERTSLDLKDRIQLALTGLQEAGQAVGGMVSQIGQAQAAQLEIHALEAQKEARKASTTLDGYIQLIQAAIKNTQNEQKQLLKEADSILSVMEDRAASIKEASMRVLRA